MAMRRLVAKPGAFALEPLLYTCVVVGFGSHLLSGVKLGMVLRCGEGSQIALPQIDAYYLRQGGGQGVWGVDGERHQEVETAFGPVIPEFGSTNRCPVLEPGHVTSIALIGED